MTYAYILSNMAIKKVLNDCSDESLNLAINDLWKGIPIRMKYMYMNDFLAAGIFQTLSVTYASTWGIQDGPPETTSDCLIALSE